MRTPQTLYYVLPAGFVGVLMANRLVFEGPFGRPFLAAIVGSAGAAAVGSSFTLNPLGTEGDALPGLLSFGMSSETIVQSKALAALLPGVVLVVGGTVVAGLTAADLSVVYLLAALVYTLALVCLAPFLALAVGIHFPPDAGGILRGDARIPHSAASTYYTAGLFTVSMPGFGVLGATTTGGEVPVFLLLAGVGTTVLVAVIATHRAYHHAVSRLSAYSIE